ncbi:ribonuclease H-like domain-containing protein [Mycena rebaudengoi]|nr:ribonuclease H-like domain-containing protein [Mycena rebaudengoi]
MSFGDVVKDYFKVGDKKYKTDKWHNETRCRACISRRILELTEHDERDVNAGVREYMRTADERHTQAEVDVVPICNKTERMVSHLRRCVNVDPDVRLRAQAASKKENTTGVRLSRTQQIARSATSNLIPPAVILACSSTPVIDPRIALNLPHSVPEPQIQLASRAHASDLMWDPPQQEDFAQDLCKLFIACNVAWNSAANPELLLFFSKYIPEAKIPDRRVLSGRVLDTLVVQAESEMKSNVAGKLGTGQCDGWKSGAKAAIITTSVTVKAKLYTVAAHDVSPERKTADNLLELVLADMQYCETEFGIIFVGYCTDNGGDARGMRVRLKRVRPKLTVPPCWGHQVNLVVGEVLELEILCMAAVDDGLEMVKWFTNHSHALGLLKEHQKLTDRFKQTGRLLVLMFPVISRWIYHFLAAHQLLTLSAPMRTLYIQDYDNLIECAGSKREAKEKAESVLEPIDNPQFWKNLAEVKILLEPLAIAAKCMQVPDAGLDQVLLMLGNLYRIYGSPVIIQRVHNCVRKSLEKRWLAMEREVFILAVFLNPYIRGSTFSAKNPALKPISLYNMAKPLFKRFFDEEPDLDFHSAFFDYSNNAREFSRTYMNLTEMKELHERENKRLNTAKIWEQLDTGETNGRNGLVKLAIWVLSIVANSAGSERGFSKFGIYLTKLRNQLSIQKVRKMNTVDMNLKQKHKELGLTKERIKRKFANFAEQYGGAGGAGTDYDDTDSFAGLATQMVRDLSDDRSAPSDDEDTDEDATIPSIHAASNYMLKELFEYPKDESDGLQNGLGFYWQGGLKDLQEELELYDLLMEDMDV